MSVKNCLLIKPRVTSAESQIQQNNAITHVIKPAIDQAGLALLGDQDGLVLNDITEPLVQQVYEADLVVVDANRYEAADPTPLSPFLCYFIGLRHTMGSRTILVARAVDHLPFTLRLHHTLTYTLEEIWQFYKQFKQVVATLEDGRPDNPIQAYFKDLEYKANAEELTRVKIELEIKEAQLAALKQSRDKKITFRRVD